MDYIIISLKHGPLVFWRSNNSGYTSSPFAAGRYTEEEVKADPGYYNNGYDTIAVPLTDCAMDEIGFSSSIKDEKIEAFIKKYAHKS